jgi:hypothetical protein
MMMVEQLQPVLEQVTGNGYFSYNGKQDRNILCSNLEIAEGGKVVVDEDVDE